MKDTETKETTGKSVKVNKKDVLCLSTTRQQLGTRRCILNTIQHLLARLVISTSDKTAVIVACRASWQKLASIGKRSLIVAFKRANQSALCSNYLSDPKRKIEYKSTKYQGEREAPPSTKPPATSASAKTRVNRLQQSKVSNNLGCAVHGGIPAAECLQAV